jgi:hypothetical protein
LVAGGKLGESVAVRIGAKLPVAAGLLVLTLGLAIGATTTADSRYRLAAAWLSVFGVGVGVALAPAMDAVLGELPSERTGSGSAVSLTLRQVGAALGCRGARQRPILGVLAVVARAGSGVRARDDGRVVVFAAVCGAGAVAVGMLLPARQS